MSRPFELSDAMKADAKTASFIPEHTHISEHPNPKIHDILLRQIEYLAGQVTGLATQLEDAQKRIRVLEQNAGIEKSAN